MDKQQKYFRKKILNYIVSDFSKDKHYYLLVGDMGFGAIDKLKEKCPKQIINCGIMEQTMVGIATGMAMSGLKPVVYSIVNFLTYRALEQIRNDVVLQNLNVKFIGTGANNYFNSLGYSHCCNQDDIYLMKLINLKVFDPYASKKSFPALVQEWIQYDKSAYIRV
ncbi:MAG: transketolase [Patescibacteria group bacterium]|jgi:transketolase|nr:transketolase [Patescibacteria group bacterium]